MRLSKLQHSAYHEAAHVIAFLHVGEPFDFVEICGRSYRNCNPSTAVGRVHYDYAPDQHYSLWRLFTVLAGPAADKYMHSSWSWGAIGLGGAGSDYKEAWEITEQLKVGGHFVDDMLRTTMMRFVREGWGRIMTLGDALLAAPERTLNYEECLIVLGR